MEEKNDSCKDNDEPWKILEFYSGIGGMRYSVMRAGVRARVLEAFDINNRANDVYEHNFGHRPHQGNIQSFTAAELDKYGADAWLLSPPCQPYTRQGLQKDSDDARASSFLKILELIPHTFRPPLMLFVENVVGFETSNTHKQMIEIFAKTGFVTQEYILTPLQFGVPYSRPRYFCLAKRKPLSFQNPHFNNQLLWRPIPLLAHEDAARKIDGCNELHLPCDPIKGFLETKTSSSNHSGERSEEKSTDGWSLDQYTVPFSLIERWGSAMGILTTFVSSLTSILLNIVYPDSKRCCCFTKSYYRYVKGTGSLLASIQNNEPMSEKDGISTLKKLGLRYFTPREVANLHSFPEDFDFPQHISLKQKYALLGNSLSVAVVAPLLRYLFSEPV